MRALTYQTYGGPEVLQLDDVPVPPVGEDEIRVEVRAVSLNASDWEFLTGSPAYVRAWGLRRPSHPILGSDVAGVVEATGPKVTGFVEGDNVFGDLLYHWGGLAERCVGPAHSWAHKPASLSFAKAAALPQAGTVALQALRDAGRVKSGHHVLVNGAGGGSGSFAIQLAKHFGARVTAVDALEKHDFMRSLGADEVIDYRREDFTNRTARFDLIVDFVASHSSVRHRRALAAAGRYVMVGGPMRRIADTLVVGSLSSVVSPKKIRMLAAEPMRGLDELVALIEADALTPVIDTVYPLTKAADALRHLGEGRAMGKVIVSPS